MITKVTGKNQITIPAAVARRLHITAGSRLEWLPDYEDADGAIRLRVKPSPDTLLREIQEIGAKYAITPAAGLATLEQLRAESETQR